MVVQVSTINPHQPATPIRYLFTNNLVAMEEEINVRFESGPEIAASVGRRATSAFYLFSRRLKGREGGDNG